jgi:hypothetical protein
MARRQNGLGRRREAAIAALLGHATIADAAVSIGLSEKTLRRWLVDPPFAAAYRTARRELVESSIVRVQQMALQAVLKFHQLLGSEQESVQLKAATGILNFALRGVELDDVLTRLEALEEKVKHQPASYPTNGHASPRSLS